MLAFFDNIDLEREKRKYILSLVPSVEQEWVLW